MNSVEMVEKYQCPGCVNGSGVDCGAFELDTGNYGPACRGHVLGSVAFPGGTFALGLPRGFCKPGPAERKDDGESPRVSNVMDIRLWPASSGAPGWDWLNVPVWAMIDDDGILFVRTFCPRLNAAYVDVIDGWDPEEWPAVPDDGPWAIDIGKHVDEID